MEAPGIVLAMDTSGPAGGVALLKEGRPVGELFLHSTSTHSRRLLRSCETLLKGLGMTYGDIGLVAVGLGPGSFTGLRIGLATAKGLAYALGIPVVGVPSLDALALTVAGCHGDYICPVVHARVGEVYCAIYRADGRGNNERVSPYQSMSPVALASRLSGMGRVWLLGNGLERQWDLFEEELGDKAVRVPSCLEPSGVVAVGSMGLEEYRRTGGHDLFSLVPLYVRASEAEMRREKTRAKSPCLHPA